MTPGFGTSACAFGLDAQTGSCQSNLTQVASNATFRDRTASVSLTKGSQEFSDDAGARFFGSVSAFYNSRRYLGRQEQAAQIGLSPALSLAGSTDKAFGVSARGERLLGNNRYITFDLRGQRNQYGLSRSGSDTFVSLQTRYEMLLDRNLNLFATGFVSQRRVDEQATVLPVSSRFDVSQRTQASVSIGLRYLFAPYRGKFTPFEHRQSRPEG